MSKISLILLIFFHALHTLYSLTISEIMYDPEGSDTNREWIEVHNEGVGSVDMRGYKFFEGGVNHTLSAVLGDGQVLAGGYAVIVDDPVVFQREFPQFSGALFDSSFSLSNAGELLSIRDGSNATIDSVTYSPTIGGNNDGTTLSRIDGVWTIGESTPGSVNVIGVAKATSTKSVAPNVSAAPDITVLVEGEKIVLAGADSTFSAKAVKSSGEAIPKVTYTWVFGDGGTLTGESVLYHYLYPGRYIAYVEASNGVMTGSGRVIVQVLAPSIKVTGVGKDEKALYIDVRNDMPYDIDMSKWYVEIAGLRYQLPEHTYFSRTSTTRINGNHLHVASTTQLGTTSLMFPNGERLLSSLYSAHEKVSAPKVVSVARTQPRAVASTTLVATTTMSTSTISMSQKNITSSRDIRLFTWLRSFFE